MCFGLVKTGMEQLASVKEVADSNASEACAGLRTRMYLLTPLALGADRMAARAALRDEGFEIFVPMPFPQKVYEEDFTGNIGKSPDAEPITAEQDLAEFRQLLSRASGRLELDGGGRSGPEDSAGRAYEAVGRFVVRHCDFLVAVWDGKPSNGRGGTAEIVHYAASAGVPSAWWINALKQTEPVWLADIHDILDPLPPEAVELSAEEKLQKYLRRLISPPVKVPGHKGFWDKVASWFEEKEISPLDAYFTEKPRARRSIWKTYSSVMKWSGGNAGEMPTAPSPQAAALPAGPVSAYWFARYANADGRASDYAERYRSGYLLTILSTMTVLACGALRTGTRCLACT